MSLLCMPALKPSTHTQSKAHPSYVVGILPAKSPLRHRSGNKTAYFAIFIAAADCQMPGGIHSKVHCSEHLAACHSNDNRSFCRESGAAAAIFGGNSHHMGQASRMPIMRCWTALLSRNVGRIRTIHSDLRSQTI